MEKAISGVASRLRHSPCMLNWRRAFDLLGETAREMGLLIVVFAPLDTLFADTPIDQLVLAVTIFVGLTLMVGGILIEARKTR